MLSIGHPLPLGVFLCLFAIYTTDLVSLAINGTNDSLYDEGNYDIFNSI